MLNTKKIFTILAMLTFLTTPAHAQWYFHQTESAFGDNSISLIATGDKVYSIALRCTDSKLEFLFFTPDVSFADETTLGVVNATSPKFLIRIDDNPALELDGKIILQDGKATILSDAPQSLLSEIENATTKVSVAMKLLGDIYHEKEFGVSRSTSVSKQLSEACQI